MKDKLPAWLVLTVICVVAAALLAGTNLLTKDVIAENTLREKYATLMALMPDAADFDETDSGVVIGKDADGNPVGYSLAATAQGFGGEVETTVAATAEGTIRGISVGGANFAETAGLGARAKEPEFQEQFVGKTAPVALTKDGGEIEALSGATITSRAVISGVNQAMEGIAAEANFTVEVTIDAEHLGENKYAASAPGFGGPVKVYLTVNEKTIEEISIGDSQFNETDGLGALAKEETFQSQFIGKTLPVTMGDIDAISGATITTNAVLEAIGKINTGLDNGLADMPITEETTAEAAAETSSSSRVRRRAAGGSSTSEAAESESHDSTTETAASESSTGTGSRRVRRTSSSSSASEETSVETTDAPPVVNQDGNTYDTSVQGFGGPVHVYLMLNEDGTIASISIGDDDFAETPGLGALAQEDDFQSQFIGKIIPMTMDDIDAITGATITSTAVVTAINAIAESAK